MPFLLAVVPYLLIEAVTFWAVATWIGVGWALLTVFILMAVGIVAAGVEMQRVGRSAAARRITPGRMAGDYGLLTVGAILAGLLAQAGLITTLQSSWGGGEPSDYVYVTSGLALVVVAIVAPEGLTGLARRSVARLFDRPAPEAAVIGGEVSDAAA